MKIIIENDFNNVTQVYACCDKCVKPNRFYLGRADEKLQNVWNPKENAYCTKCGAKLDWENLNIKAYEEVKNYEDKIKAIERQETIEELKNEIENTTWYHVHNGELIEGANGENDEPLYKYADIKRIFDSYGAEDE